MPTAPVVVDLLPGFPVWPEDHEKQLELDLHELRTFHDYEGFLHSMIWPEKPIQTALHSWGSQAKPCLCGCRSAGFTLSRLADKGLFGAVVWLPGTVQGRSSAYQRCRHIHSEEAALLNGVPPSFLVQKGQHRLRFELVGIGQLTSPIQSAWVTSEVLRQISQSIQISVPSPESVMSQLFQQLFAERDLWFPSLPKHPRYASFVQAIQTTFADVGFQRI